MIQRRGLRADEVDWYVPPYSSQHFRDVMYEVMPDNWKIPQSRWFTNLAENGNVGSGSFYLLLAGLLQSGQLKAGPLVLCFVQESGRFSLAFCCLRVVPAFNTQKYRRTDCL